MKSGNRDNSSMQLKLVFFDPRRLQSKGQFWPISTYSDVDEFEFQPWELRVSLCLEAVSGVDK